MAYSLLGLQNPTQWGIGGKSNFVTRFGDSMQRGMQYGDTMDRMVGAQQTRQATQPYKDMASIAKSREITAQSQLETLRAAKKTQYAACAYNGWTTPECRALRDEDTKLSTAASTEAALPSYLAPRTARDFLSSPATPQLMYDDQGYALDGSANDQLMYDDQGYPLNG